MRAIDSDALKEYIKKTDLTAVERGALLQAISNMPTLTPPNEPLTLEQLRGMDDQPVWVKVIGITDIRCDGWCEVEFKDKNTPNEIVCVWWPGSEVEDIAKSEDYGKTWVCYAYPPAHIGGPCHACGYGGKHLDSPPCTTCPAHPKTPAHIDREAWKPCEKCVGCGNCNYFLYDDDESPCDKCLRGSTDEKPYPEFSPIAFCKHCGRPLTPEARAIQEKRLRG